MIGPSAAPSDAAAAAATRPAHPARLAGGVTVITGAKVWFVLSGYALYFGLTRLLGPERFGLYSVVISIVSVLNNVLIGASLSTVSRFVARDPDRAGSVLRGARRVQLALGFGLSLALASAAPLVGRGFRDPGLVTPLQVAAGIVFAYALYAANVGFLNGGRHFGRQAALDSTFSTLKLALVLGAVGLGLGVVGAAAGFTLAAFLILGISFFAVRGAPRGAGGFSARAYLGFGGWLVALTLVANLVLSADLWIVKRMSDPAIANQQAGLYRAAITLAQLLYQLLIPITLVVFPHLARLGDAPDPAEGRRILRGALRYLAVTVIPGAALLGIAGPNLVALLYGAAYRGGGGWLALLGPAYALWTGAFLVATALAGAGRPRAGVILLAAGFAGQVIAGVAFFPLLGPAGAALGDLVGMGLGFALGLGVVRRAFGPVMPWASVARGVLLALLLGGVAWWWRPAGALLVLELALLAVAGLVFLVASGEIALPRGHRPGGAGGAAA